MQALYGHTIDFGKLRERITVRHLIEGLGCIAGLPYCERTIRHHLDQLAKLGAIMRHRTREGYVYAINMQWSPSEPGFTACEASVALAISKKHKASNRVVLTDEHVEVVETLVKRERVRLPVAKSASKNCHSELANTAYSYTQEDTTTLR